VPWTRAAPVLVVEAGGKPFTFPRDWFLTEADQRRIVRELHARGSGRGASTDEVVDGPRWWAVDPVPLHRGDGLGPLVAGKAGGFALHAGGVAEGGRELRFADAELLGSSYVEYAMPAAKLHGTRAPAAPKVMAYTYAWQREHRDQLEQMVVRDRVPPKATRTGVTSKELRLCAGDVTIQIPAEHAGRVQLGVFRHRFPAIAEAYERGETVSFGPLHCTSEGLDSGDQALPWSAIDALRLEGGNLFVVSKGKPKKLAHWGEIPNVSMLLTLLNVVIGLDVDSETGRAEVAASAEPQTVLASEPA